MLNTFFGEGMSLALNVLEIGKINRQRWTHWGVCQFRVIPLYSPVLHPYNDACGFKTWRVSLALCFAENTSSLVSGTRRISCCSHSAKLLLLNFSNSNFTTRFQNISGPITLSSICAFQDSIWAKIILSQEEISLVYWVVST